MLLSRALRLNLNPAAPDVVAMVGGGGKSSAAFRLAAEVAATGRRAVVAPTTRIAAFQTEWAPAFIEVGEAAEIPWATLEVQLAAHNYCLLGGLIAGDRRLGLTPRQVDRLAQRSAELGIAAITIEADGSKMRPIKAPAEHEPVLPDAITHLAPVAGMDAVGAAIDERLMHRPEYVRRVLGLESNAAPRLTPAMLARLLSHPAGGAKGLRSAMRFTPILNKADTPLHLSYARLTAAILAQCSVSSLVARVGDIEHAPVIERWGEVAVIVLAAGGSRRMGQLKQMAAIGGEPMLARAVRTALRGAGGPVVVVTGAEQAAVDAALTEWREHVVVVHNAMWEAGQSTSVAAAIAALPHSVEAAIFMPVDQPFLDPLLLRRLRSAWQGGADLVTPHVDGEERGAPALFDRCYWNELLALEGDIGGRRVLATHRSEVVTVPALATWLLDVDTADDLAALQRESIVGK